MATFKLVEKLIGTSVCPDHINQLLCSVFEALGGEVTPANRHCSFVNTHQAPNGCVVGRIVKMDDVFRSLESVRSLERESRDGQKNVRSVIFSRIVACQAHLAWNIILLEEELSNVVWN